MKYSLIVDIGNSQIEMGLFSPKEMVGKFHFETSKIEIECEKQPLKSFLKRLNINPSDIDGGLIFSVVPHVTKLVQILIQNEIGLIIDIFNPTKTLKELKCNVDNPNEIGQDLIADIVGAINEYGSPIIVSDLGTVTKNIIIDKNGIFQGVSFFPGVELNVKTLTAKTAQLPEIDFKKPKIFFGKNTIEAMSSGIYYCHVEAIKGFMENTEQYFGYEFKKVITGGLSSLFSNDFLSPKYILDPDLVLKGMYLIYKNQK